MTADSKVFSVIENRIMLNTFIQIIMSSNQKYNVYNYSGIGNLICFPDL